MGATWSPTTGPSADVTSPPELTVPATTLQSDSDEQQSTEDSSDDSTQIYVYAIIALSVIVVAFIGHTVHNKRKQHAPFAPNQPDNRNTVTNPTHNAQHVQQSAPTVSGDVAGTYEPAQTLNPNYEPTLPERMRNRVCAEINSNVAGIPGHPDRQQDEDGYVAMHLPQTTGTSQPAGDQQVYDQFYECPPDRHTDSSA